METVSIERARAAKELAKARLAGVSGVVGIGLTKIGNSYGIKINLSQPPENPAAIPDVIEGVPVCWEIVGRIARSLV
jgi:hypothetical protein